MPISLKNPLIVALDIDSKSEVLHLARTLGPRVGALKLGPRLVIRYGSDFVSQISKISPVFLDFKFLDIPNTMVSSLRAAFDAGASLCTVHAWAGDAALKEVYKVEQELNKMRPFRVLVVTILTSFSDQTLPPGLEKTSAKDHVLMLAELAYKNGLRGIVCSPEEAAILREKYSDLYLVTPGVRLPDEETGDQKRVMGPKEAIKAGANAIVVGRPIVESKDPAGAVDKYLNALR